MIVRTQLKVNTFWSNALKLNTFVLRRRSDHTKYVVRMPAYWLRKSIPYCMLPRLFWYNTCFFFWAFFFFCSFFRALCEPTQKAPPVQLCRAISAACRASAQRDSKPIAVLKLLRRQFHQCSSAVAVHTQRVTTNMRRGAACFLSLKCRHVDTNTAVFLFCSAHATQDYFRQSLPARLPTLACHTRE